MLDLMQNDLDLPELQTAFLFRRRPIAIPGDLRPGWRIALIVLLLKKCCRSGRSTHKRLHVLNWGISTVDNRLDLQSAIRGSLSPHIVIVRFDPFLSRAVDFAIGEGLVKRAGGDKVELTPLGKAFAVELEQSEGIYVVEKQFMDSIRQSVTESLVNQMFART